MYFFLAHFLISLNSLFCVYASKYYFISTNLRVELNVQILLFHSFIILLNFDDSFFNAIVSIYLQYFPFGYWYINYL